MIARAGVQKKHAQHGARSCNATCTPVQPHVHARARTPAIARVPRARASPLPATAAWRPLAGSAASTALPEHVTGRHHSLRTGGGVTKPCAVRLSSGSCEGPRVSPPPPRSLEFPEALKGRAGRAHWHCSGWSWWGWVWCSEAYLGSFSGNHGKK